MTEKILNFQIHCKQLEQQVAELNRQIVLLKQSNTSLRQQLSVYQAAESRRARWDHDHLPYGDDDHDR